MSRTSLLKNMIMLIIYSIINFWLFFVPENRQNQRNMLGSVLEHNAKVVDFRPWNSPTDKFLSAPLMQGDSKIMGQT
ncbi:UNVERIFIED_CONTAM: hypothetical protein NCL1_11873 [Trichonephila clavipes]